MTDRNHAFGLILLPLCASMLTSFMLFEPAFAASREQILQSCQEAARSQVQSCMQAKQGSGDRETNLAACRKSVMPSVRACVQRESPRAPADQAARTAPKTNTPAAPKEVAAPKDSGLAEFHLFEFTPWLVTNHGPAAAKGVIYFVQGWQGPTTLDDFHLVPYFVKSLSEDGWDIVAAKMPQTIPQRRADPGFHDLAPPAIGQRIRALKAQGYRRVVLAGHSWGGWVSMLAAQDGDLPADALLLTAPAVGTSRRPDGQPNPRFKKNFTEFPRVVDNIKIPTIFMVYAGDEQDPPGRGDIAKATLQRKKLPHLVINHPVGFTGHFAGWLPIFDFEFGRCIQSFLENPQSDVCPLSPLRNNDFRSILALSQIADAASRRISSTDRLVGRKFAIYTLDAPFRLAEFVTPVRRWLVGAVGEAMQEVFVRDGLLCADNTCSILIQWSDREILAFDPKTGNLRSWWIEL